MRFTTRLVYGVYAWAVLAVIVTPMTLLLAVVPGATRRRALAQRAARLYFRCLGSPVQLEAVELLGESACVVVANHSSYLDGLILTAALPARFTFVIKEEMAAVPIASLILRRLGAEFVRREDSAHRRLIGRRLLKAARVGAALAVFPEATFDANPGLKRFQLGAFRIARHANVPLVPVVIHGARRKLGAGRWLPIPGPLQVRICEPLAPVAFPCAHSLMLAARARMLLHLPEPDLHGPAGEPVLPLHAADDASAGR